MRLSKKDKLRIAGIIKNKQYVGPKKVNIHLNSVCNFACDFCWFHSNLVTRKPDPQWQLKLEEVKRAIDDCREMGVEQICLEGDGEAFLWRGFEEVMQYILSNGMEIGYIDSNGSFPDSQLELISNANVLKINLSAATDNTHTLLQSKKEGEFKRVVDNLIRLKSFSGIKPKIELIFVVTGKNCHEVMDYMGLAKKVRADKVNFKVFEATEETKTLIVDEKQRALLLKDLGKIAGNNKNVQNNSEEMLDLLNSKDYGKNRYSVNWENLHSDRHFYFTTHNYKNMGCYVGWFYSFIDPQGQVIALCDGVGIKVLGNIKEKRLKDIWFSKENLDLLRDAKSSIDLSKEKWQECRYCGYCEFNKKVDKVIKRLQGDKK